MATDDYNYDVQLPGPNDDEDGADIDVGEDAGPPPFVYDEEQPNLCLAFYSHPDGKEAIKKIAKQVLDEVKTARDDSEEYREQKAKDWLIFTGKLPKKSFPFEDSANAHLPIMMENLTRLMFRAVSEMFPDESNVFTFDPMGPDDTEIANAMTRHTNWQLGTRVPGFYRQQHRGILMFYVDGDVSAHSYYDSVRGTNRHDILSTDDIVVPYIYTSTMDDYSDCPFVCRILRYYRYEVEQMKDQWYEVERIIERKAPAWGEEGQELREAAEEWEKIRASSGTRAPYQLYLWEGWLRLPNQTRERYCQVVVDVTTEHVAKLAIHEEPTWDERERFRRETQELSEYTQMLVHYEQNPFIVDPATGAVQPTTPPQAPPWFQEGMVGPEPMRKQPIHMFSHGVCIESLVGNLGFGFGRGQADLNRAANTGLSQFTDSATLANARAFVTTGNLNLDRPLKIAPGRVHQAKGIGSADLKNQILPLETGPANPQLLDLVKFMSDHAESSIQAPGVLSGEPGKSGETFRGIATRVEQATKQLTAATRKYRSFLENIVKNNCRLNALFMPDVEVFSVNDHLKGYVQEKVSREMYTQGYRVKLRADLKFASQATRIQEADMLVTAGVQNPYLAQNAAFNWHAIKKALEARDLHEMVKLLGPEPVPPAMFMAAPPPGQQAKEQAPSENVEQAQPE